MSHCTEVGRCNDIPEVGLNLYFTTELVLHLSLLQLALEQDLEGVCILPLYYGIKLVVN